MHYFPKRNLTFSTERISFGSHFTVCSPIKSDVNALEVICVIVIPIPSSIAPRITVNCMEIPKIVCNEKLYQKRTEERNTKFNPTIIVAFRPKY